MSHATSKAELMRQMSEARAAWEARLAQLSPAALEQPGIMGEWTGKDLIAHLTGWWQYELYRLTEARTGQPPAKSWPDDLRETEAINQWIYTTYRSRPAAEVLEESRQVWRDLEAGLQAMAEADLMTPGRYPRMQGQAFGPALLASMTGHLDDEHAADMARLVAAGSSR